MADVAGEPTDELGDLIGVEPELAKARVRIDAGRIDPKQPAHRILAPLQDGLVIVGRSRRTRISLTLKHRKCLRHDIAIDRGVWTRIATSVMK